MVTPKEYRERAARCIDMANVSQDTGEQSALFDGAKTWLALAAQAESRPPEHEAAQGRPRGD